MATGVKQATCLLQLTCGMDDVMPRVPVARGSEASASHSWRFLGSPPASLSTGGLKLQTKTHLSHTASQGGAEDERTVTYREQAWMGMRTKWQRPR